MLTFLPNLGKKMVVGKCSYPECYNTDNCNDKDFIDAKTL